MMPAETHRQRLDRRLAALKTDRESYDSHFRELFESFSPRRGRFYAPKNPRGEKMNRHIVNNAPLLARRILQAGMTSGLSSPSRPWFRLTTSEPALNELGNVRAWLGQVEARMRLIFARSNLYTTLSALYGELGTIATAPILVLEDAKSVIRCFGFTGGQYYIAADERGAVDTLAYEMPMTVRQMVREFGLERVSVAVADLYRRGDYERLHTVARLIQPRGDLEPGFRSPFISAYWETEARRDETGSLLALRGFEEQPFMCPRWDVVPGDVYGSECPGFDTLGDARALQLQEKRKAQAIDKMVDPALQGPGSLRNAAVSSLPGSFTPVDPMQGGNQKVEPIYQVAPDAQLLLEDIAAMRERIFAGWFADLFLMLAQTDRRQITAREVEERHEEKLLQLGPVLERLNDDLFDPLIDRTFNIMVRKSQPIWDGVLDGEPLIPPPPEELEGHPLKVEYISILAQAQKLIGITAVERLAGYVTQVAGIVPTIVDKFDFDQSVDEMADMLGVPVDIIRSDEEVDAVRAGRAQAEQAQAMAAAAQPINQAAGAVKQLAETPMGTDSALDRMLEQMGAA